MTPPRIPRDTPGFDPWRGKTPQPRTTVDWLKLFRWIARLWRESYPSKKPSVGGRR